MVQWNDPATIMSQAAIFGQVMWVLLGIMSWEIISTITFDLRTIKKWRDFKVGRSLFVAGPDSDILF